MGHLRLCGAVAVATTISQEPCEPSQGLLANLRRKTHPSWNRRGCLKQRQLIVRTQFLLSHKHLLHRARKGAWLLPRQNPREIRSSTVAELVRTAISH